MRCALWYSKNLQTFLCHFYEVIEFDIVSFLTRDNVSMTEQYGGFSPQFNTHYRFIEVLTHMGYTGVCFGGNAPEKHGQEYGKNLEKNQMHWVKCNDKFQIAVQGSFLSFSPELALALAVSTPIIGQELPDNTTDWEEYKKWKKYYPQQWIPIAIETRIFSLVCTYLPAGRLAKLITKPPVCRQAGATIHSWDM